MRHQDEYIAVRELVRGPEGKLPADSIRKSGEHAPEGGLASAIAAPPAVAVTSPFDRVWEESTSFPGRPST